MATKNEKLNSAKSGVRVYCTNTPVVEKKHTGARNYAPSDSVIKALAAAADVDPFELPPLFEYIDTDNIDMLVQEYERNSTTPPPYITFEVEKWAVFVRADGIIRIFDTTDTNELVPVFEETSA